MPFSWNEAFQHRQDRSLARMVTVGHDDSEGILIWIHNDRSRQRERLALIIE